MEEFARMIYEQWAKAQMDRDLYFDKGSDLMNRLGFRPYEQTGKDFIP